MNRVTFPTGTLRCNSTAGVRFRSLLDNAIVVFDLSADVLIDRFGAASNHCPALIRAFEKNREMIESAARAKLYSQETAGRVTLTDRDFALLAETATVTH